MKSKILIYLLLSTLISCGGSNNNNSDDFEREEEQLPEPETIQKIYRSDLRAVNPSIENDLEGQVVIRLEDESFEANVILREVPSISHPQHIRTGKKCPDQTADVNGDGRIDLAEAEAVSGTVYIPLDDDLENFLQDNLVYPNGGFVRAYVYREETTRKQVVSEVGPESNLDLENRVVMVLGVEDDETLPLACGELFKVIGPE